MHIAHCKIYSLDNQTATFLLVEMLAIIKFVDFLYIFWVGN